MVDNPQKRRLGVYLTIETIADLDRLRGLESRSQSNMIEQLIRRAAKAATTEADKCPTITETTDTG